MLAGADDCLRLAYSGVTPEEIEQGVKRLAEAYAEVASSSNSSVFQDADESAARSASSVS